MNGNFKGGFGGGFGGASMQALMKQAQKMQEDLEKSKEEIIASEFCATVGGGALQVVMTGDKKVKSIKIKPEIVDSDDIEMLEDLIKAGVNDALNQIEIVEKEKMPNLPIGM
ncbi:MAG: YbaB/EbfC family nucleoid-associated protein [Clostridia bacterium]